MSGVELGARYQAGSKGATVTYPSGSVVQLAPFALVLFSDQPRKIEGRLYRLGARGRPAYETPTLEPEVKAW